MKQNKFPHLTKEFFEQEFAAGKTAAQIQREQGIPPGNMGYYLKKVGVTMPQAKDRYTPQEVDNVGSEQTVDQIEIERLRKVLAKTIGERNRNQVNLSVAEGEIDKWKAKATETVALAGMAIDQSNADSKLASVQKYISSLLGVDPRSAIFELIATERQRQDRLHPSFPADLRMEILVEEVGEVAKAKLEGKPADMRKELIEVAAVAVRWLEFLDMESNIKGG